MTSEVYEIANPTIRQVFGEFLAEQQQRLSARTFAEYRYIVELLEDSLNGYAYSGLDDDEAELFDRLYNAEGDEHREFCEIFGPDHILSNLDEFLGYYLIRKVIGPKDLLKSAAKVTKKLTKWLVEKGYETDVDAMPSTDRMVRDLLQVGELAEALRELAPAMGPPPGVKDQEGHFEITRIKPGKIWLSNLAGEKVGPVDLPRRLSELCHPGWTISGIVGRKGRKWALLEVWNVYP